jgi:hypothetical protein
MYFAHHLTEPPGIALIVYLHASDAVRDEYGVMSM